MTGMCDARPVRTHGWTTPFAPTNWREIERFLGGVVEMAPQFGYLTDIVRSVIASGQADALAACHT